jgi:hypothetical protein
VDRYEDERDEGDGDEEDDNRKKKSGVAGGEVYIQKSRIGGVLVLDTGVLGGGEEVKEFKEQGKGKGGEEESDSSKGIESD